MEKCLNMTIITPEGILFEGQVEQANFPGTMGTFTIWPDHAALMSGLTSGKISYTNKAHHYEIPLQSGFVEIKNNIILACIETKDKK